MLAYNHVPQQYFKPLNIQTGIEYNIDTGKFPGLTNTGHEPTLVVAQTEMEKPELSPLEKNQSSETITTFDPFSDNLTHNVEKLSYPHNQAEFQLGRDMPRCQSMINQIRGDSEFNNFEEDSQISKQTHQVYPKQQMNVPTHSKYTSSQGIQRRLSYGTEQPESDGQNFNSIRVEGVRNTPIPCAKTLNRKHQSLQSDLIPSTVLSCLDPFDDSMSHSRTDGTFSGVSTPVSTTPEYSHSSTNSHYQHLNTSYPQLQSGSTRTFPRSPQDHQTGPNLQAVLQQQQQQPFVPNYTSGSNAAIANNRGFCEKYGLPNSLFTAPSDHLFRLDRMAAPTNVKKYPRFQRPQQDTINPRVLAARRERQTLSRKRSADNMHEFLPENNKRPRRNHIEVYGVEESSQLLPASKGMPLLPNVAQFPMPPEVTSEDNPVQSFDEYSCPARPKSEIPNISQRRHTGTIHYYGATQSSANPLAKRFNPNFKQQNTARSNTLNHPGPETNRSQFCVNVSTQNYNPVSSTCSYTKVGTQYNSPANSLPPNCTSQNIPMNACVTKDTFLDILYAN